MVRNPNCHTLLPKAMESFNEVSSEKTFPSWKSLYWPIIRKCVMEKEKCSRLHGINYTAYRTFRKGQVGSIVPVSIRRGWTCIAFNRYVGFGRLCKFGEWKCSSSNKLKMLFLMSRPRRVRFWRRKFRVFGSNITFLVPPHGKYNSLKSFSTFELWLSPII